MKQYLDMTPEVREAIERGKPVVALESTIISHGMPYPQNVETARKVEAIIREQGAVPATIAVLGGRLKAGLTDDELEYLGKSPGIKKVSRRDLPAVVALNQDGATTVASTMIIAALAGIKVFVTGGIGGVHRGAQETFDISADLMELAGTAVAVVCAGAKSILDIGLTLEVLETHGVPVLGFETDDFPAFYTRTSGFGVDIRVNSADEAARVMQAKWDLGLRGGLLIGNPIPEEYAMQEEVIRNAIETALREAEAQGIRGKDMTPFLLARVKGLTDGKSLDSNIQLVYNNARVGAQIAVAFTGLR